MDYPHRSPPSDSDDSTRAVTGSAVQSPPAGNPLASRAVAGTPVRSPATNDSIVDRAPAVRGEAVSEYPVRSPPTNNPPSPRAPAVREEAVTGSQVRSPQATRASAAREEAVAGSPLRSPSHHSQPKENTRAFVPRTRTWIIPNEPVTESAVRSPSPSAEKNQAAPTKDTTAVTGSPVQSPQTNCSLASRDSTTRDEVVTRSPVWSPEKEARATVPPASSVSDEAVTGSPVSSPHHEAIKYEKQNSFYSVSSYQSPNRDVENPNPNASPWHKETVYSLPLRGAMTVGSLIRSPLGDETTEDPISLEKATSPMMPMANRMVARETTSTPKVGGRNGAMRGLTRVEEGALRQPATRKTAVGLRIVTLVLSLISFSIMAADKTYGWDGDSFDRYTEFRYCLSINVLVFAYSFFQVFVQLHHKIKKRRIMSRPISYSFDFLMDQILAYLLMSASSASASRNGDWVTDFGSDDFTKKINASIAMSFLAFFALAVSSIISAYKFFSWKY